MEDYTSSIQNCKPGEVVDLPDGRKIIVGIDGDYEVVDRLDDFQRLLDLGDDDDGGWKDDTLRIGKGEAVRVQLIDVDPEDRRVARHQWLGQVAIVCAKHTSSALLPKGCNSACPLCELPDEVRLKLSLDCYLPVLRLNVKKRGRQWEEDVQRPVRILRLKGRLFNDLIAILQTTSAQPTLVVGRRDDQYGSYYINRANRQEPASERKQAPPRLALPSVEPYEDLVKLADTIKAANGIQPLPGRVAKYRRMFPGCPLIALVWGRKKPLRRGYTDPGKLREWMDDPEYLRQMDEVCGIMLHLEKPHGVADLDRDEDIEEFLHLNP